MFVLYALLCAIICGGGYAVNKFFKYEGIKYAAGMFDDEDAMDMMSGELSYLPPYGACNVSFFLKLKF